MNLISFTLFHNLTQLHGAAEVVGQLVKNPSHGGATVKHSCTVSWTVSWTILRSLIPPFLLTLILWQAVVHFFTLIWAEHAFNVLMHVWWHVVLSMQIFGFVVLFIVTVLLVNYQIVVQHVVNLLAHYYLFTKYLLVLLVLHNTVSFAH